MQPVSRTKNVTSGLLLVGIGAFFLYSGRSLEVSQVSNMGPGYFPLMLSGLLVVLGLVVVVTSFLSTEEGSTESSGPIPWRGILLLTAALLFFGLLVRPLGLGPALGGAVAISSFASQRWRFLPTLVLTASMMACGWIVFIRILGMPVPFLGPWFH